jgi:hypothetical protein
MDHNEMVEMAREIMRQKPFLALASLFSPQKVEGFSKIRVGSDHDGGYIMLDDFSNIDLALSFGVDTNADWDVGVANRNVGVQQYDHTIDSAPIVHDRIKFFKNKIVAASADSSEVSIHSILEGAQITRDASVILKIDIESDEWPVFDACAVEDLKRFSQILVEFHNFAYSRDSVWLRRATRVMEKLASIFGVYHVHANNWCAMAAVGNVYFPDGLEVSFANRERYKLVEATELFPTPLDQANNPLKPDLYLGAFKFNQLCR